MRIQYVSREYFKTSTWSGGSTTEYFIYPEGADYAKREFKVRISGATMEQETSTYTRLDGVTRYLTPLSNNLILTINGKKEKVKPFQVVTFSGEDTVVCDGCGADFNLMLKNCAGKMQVYPAEKTDRELIINEDKIYVIFSPEGKTKIRSNNGIYEFDENGILILEGEKEEGIVLMPSLCKTIWCEFEKVHHDM